MPRGADGRRAEMASEAPRMRCARAPGAGEPAAGPEASRVMVKRGFSAILQLVSTIYVGRGMGRLTLSSDRGDRERSQRGGDALRHDLNISSEGPRGAGDQLGVPLVHGDYVDVNWPELLLGLIHAIGALEKFGARATIGPMGVVSTSRG